MGALDDHQDPICHDAGLVGTESHDRAVVQRFRGWLASHPDRVDYYCEHGSYVGYRRALAFKCRLCSED